MNLLIKLFSAVCSHFPEAQLSLSPMSLVHWVGCGNCPSPASTRVCRDRQHGSPFLSGLWSLFSFLRNFYLGLPGVRPTWRSPTPQRSCRKLQLVLWTLPCNVLASLHRCFEYRGDHQNCSGPTLWLATFQHRMGHEQALGPREGRTLICALPFASPRWACSQQVLGHWRRW